MSESGRQHQSLEALKSLRAPSLLTPSQVARIEREIDNRVVRVRSHSGLRKFVVITGIIVGPLAFASIAREFYLRRTQIAEPRAAPVTAAAEEVQPVAPEVTLGPIEPSTEPSKPTASERPGLSAESRLIYRALSHLRQKHDAVGAIAILDTYARQFPRGELREEAALARAQALTSMNNLDAALEALESVQRLPTARVLRAELLISTNRHAEALTMLDGLSRQRLPNDVLERTLIARLSCHLKLSAHDAARDDINEYLERFPQGRQAERLRTIRDQLNGR
jgi:hypothetical protein